MASDKSELVFYSTGVVSLLLGIYYVSREVFPPVLLRIEMLLISVSLLLTILSAKAYVSRRLPVAAVALLTTIAFGLGEVLDRMIRLHISAKLCAQAPKGPACAVLASAKEPSQVFSPVAGVVLAISAILIFGPPFYRRHFDKTGRPGQPERPTSARESV